MSETSTTNQIPDWARPGLLELISQSSSEFHYIQNSAGQLVYVSPSVQKLVGYTPEEFVANCFDIPDPNSPRTLAAQAEWAHTKDIPVGEPIGPYLMDITHRDGSPRTHEVSERWMLDAEGQKYLIGMAVDVTERMIVESKFDHVQRLTGVVNYFGNITPEGVKTVYLGPSFESVFDLPREDVMKNSSEFMRNVHPDDIEELREKVVELFEGRGPDRWDYKYRILFRDGSVHWLSDRGVIERGLDGQPRRWIGLAEDITGQVLAEQEQARRDGLMVQGQKLEAVGHLAAGVAHNFSNLLLAIQGYIGLAQRTLEPNHPAIEALSKIEETSELARGITRSLLTFTRQHPTRPAPLDLSGMLENAIRLLRRTLPTTLRIHQHIQPGVRVLGDGSQIDQVLLNSALNARDAMPDGGDLTIELTSEDGLARLHIIDTGQGMDEATLARAFEPFFTTKLPENGTGLGLSISRGIITDHGGSISLRSVPGGGTRVEIELPTLPGQAAESPGDRAADSSGGVALLVHPPGLVRRIVKAMLGEFGYEVAIADSLSEAHDLAARAETAVLLVDPATEWISNHGTPEAFVQALLDSADATRVVIVTDQPDRWVGLRLGEQGAVLSRPFMRKDLSVALTRDPASP